MGIIKGNIAIDKRIPRKGVIQIIDNSVPNRGDICGSGNKFASDILGWNFI